MGQQVGILKIDEIFLVIKPLTA